MPCLPSLSRTARKTLNLFMTTAAHGRQSSRLFSNHKGSHGDELLIRFSEVVKRFSRRPSPPSPEIGARPRLPHPFDYNALMKAFSQAGQVDQVLRLFREMKDFRCEPDVACYTTVIDSLVKSDRPKEAIAVFIDMISLGFAPDVACYTVLVKLYSCCLREFDSAYEVVRWMGKCGCSPDVITYSTLITGLCRDGRVEEALGVLDYMLEEECWPNVHTYTPIVQAYCSLGRIGDAKRLVSTMESIGCSPNTVTYNILIEAICKVGELDEAKKVLEESGMKGWKPDVITYSIYMNALCKWDKADKTFEQLEVMLGKGLCPNAVTLNILLDCLCRGLNAWEAKYLLERSAELDWDVGVVNYNTVMSRLCDSGRWLSVMKLFTDMLKKGIMANTRTFSIVIHSLCKAGELRQAKCIFNSEGFVANAVTYTTLIHYFYAAGEMDEVPLLFSKMGAEKVFPNAVTHSIIVDFLCRQGKFLEAIECFHRSLVNGFQPNLVARLTKWLVRGGEIKAALNLFKQLVGWGLTIDVCIFHSLIKAFCGKGFCQSREIFTVCHILDIMLGMR